MCANMKEFQTISERIFELEQEKAKKKREMDALDMKIKQLKGETSSYLKKRQKKILVVAGLEVLFTAYVQLRFDKDAFIAGEEDWWTNLGMTDCEVIGLCHAHGECEQFHSEIKTDMDVERLPSGKFETNELVLELTILAYNILRMIGQESIGRKGTETKHKVRRRRLRTVIGNMIMMASHVTEHARQLLIGLGRSNIWRHAFAGVYTAFADFQL